MGLIPHSEFDVEGDFSLILLNLMRDEQTISMSLDKIDPSEIAAHCGRPAGYMWHVSREYYKEHDKVVPKHLIIKKVEERIRAVEQFDEDDSNRVADFLVWAYEQVAAEDISYKDVEEPITDFLRKVKINAPLAAYLTNDEMSVDELRSKMEQGMSEATFVVDQPLDAMSFFSEVSDQPAATPVGGAEIGYFNRLWQGGPMPGEIALLVGPTGGYKTTMSIDVCSAMARAEEYSMYLTYEQAFTGTTILNTRMISGLTRMPEDKWKSANLGNLSAQEKAQLNMANSCSKYLMIQDRTRNIDAVSDIAKLVEAACKSGRAPRLVVLDQLQTWLNAHGDVDEANLRHRMRDVIKELKTHVCERFGTSMLCLHQLAAKLCGGNPGRVPKIADAAECKGVPQWADFMFLLGNEQKDTNVLWTVAAKTRRGCYTQTLVKAYGDVCHFVDVDDDYEVYDGKIAKKGESNRPPDIEEAAGFGGLEPGGH